MAELSRPDALGIITDTINERCAEAGLDPAMILESVIDAFVQMAVEASDAES